MSVAGALKGLGLALGAVVVLAAAAVAVDQAVLNQRILPNVTVAGQPVGGLSVADARDKAQRATTDLGSFQIAVASSDRTWTASAADLGFFYDFDSALRNAFDIGHNGGLLAGLQTQLTLMRQPASVDVKLASDDRKLSQWVQQVAGQVDRPAVDASLAVKDGNVSVLPGQPGLRVDQAALENAIRQAMAAGSHGPLALPSTSVPQARTALQLAAAADEVRALFGDSPIHLHAGSKTWDFSAGDVRPLVKWQLPPAPATHLALTVDPAPLRGRIQQLARDVNHGSQNAVLGWDGSAMTIVQPSQDAVQLDVDGTVKALGQALTQTQRDVQAVVTTQPPKITADSLSGLGIKELVAEGDSNFSGSAWERIVNIRKMAGLVNGTLIAPGEVFSFNQVMGDIGPNEGWAEGLVIMDGRTVPGLGGGICQVSTTTFRAAFWSGLPILERHDHAYPVPYYTQGGYPEGFDATVWSPDLDLKFKNDTPGYIYVQSAVDLDNQNLTISFFGSKVPGRTVTMQGPYISNVRPAPPAKHIPQPSLAKGVVQQTDYPHAGMHVELRRVVKDPAGTRTDNFISDYEPWAPVFLEGTGGEQPSPTPSASPSPAAASPAAASSAAPATAAAPKAA